MIVQFADTDNAILQTRQRERLAWAASGKAKANAGNALRCAKSIIAIYYIMHEICRIPHDSVHLPATKLSVQLVHSPETFASLEPEWDSLLRQSETNSIFQTWRYLSLWWKHFGSKSELAILTARREGELLGIAPLQIRRGKSGPRKHLLHLCFLGSLAPAEGLLFDFIVRKGEEIPVMEAFFAASSPLFSLHWDLLYLPFPPSQSPCIAALRNAAGPLHARLREIPQEDSPLIEFRPSWEDFLATLSCKFRGNLRTAIRGLQEKVGAEEIRAGRDMSVAAMHEALTSFSSARWKDERKTPLSPEFLGFERDLLETFHRDGLLEFYGWRKGEVMISLNCCFAHNSLLWGYQMGWNPEFARHSPGQVAMASVVRHGIEQGFRGLNMLLGGGSYKSAWAASAISLCRLEAVHLRSAKGNLFGAVKSAQKTWQNLRPKHGKQDTSERVA